MYAIYYETQHGEGGRGRSGRVGGYPGATEFDAKLACTRMAAERGEIITRWKEVMTLAAWNQRAADLAAGVVV